VEETKEFLKAYQRIVEAMERMERAGLLRMPNGIERIKRRHNLYERKEEGEDG
jgi:hypothetical protein